MNLFEMITRPYVKDDGPAACYHPHMIRTVRTSKYGLKRAVWIARCPDCPALAGSVVGPPYVVPWHLGRST